MSYNKRPKYGNKKVKTQSGRTFDSIKEYNRFNELVMLVNAGVITDLECQKYFIIVPKIGNNKRERYYIADFVYIEDGRKVIEDVKSPITKKNPVYSLKKALVLALYPDYIFKEY